MGIVIKKALTPKDIQACMDLRRTIFVEGQNVPLNVDLDGKDEESDHYLLFIDKHAVGVARVRFIEDFAKIERVGVLNSHQGRGYGKEIMKAILFDLKYHTKALKAKLSAQEHAIIFYEKLGFEICSQKYLDAGIWHQDMILNLALSDF